MQIYTREFAKVFNIEFTDFIKKVAPLIETFYSQTSISANNKFVLDLCCGTGHLANEFLKRGYSVVGIDISEHMLAYAKENNRDFLPSGRAEFILGNILEYQARKVFGLITCTYDSINHLDDEQELLKCFDLAYRGLVRGGFFIFDINTRASLDNWNALSVSEKTDRMIISRGFYDRKCSKAVIRFSGFVHKYNGLFEKFEQIIYNAVFDTQVIEKFLREIGWSKFYFATIEDLSKPIDEPEIINKENTLVVIACK